MTMRVKEWKITVNHFPEVSNKIAAVVRDPCSEISMCQFTRVILNQMAVLCRMPTTQYSARSARLSVHKLFTSCIWRSLVSRDSVGDGDWLAATEWCQRYLLCCQLASDDAENFGGFLYVVYRPGNDFELIPTVKMETIHPVEGYFW